MRYSLDLSALLDGWRRHYPPGVFPTIWRQLEQLIEAGELRATEEILSEVAKKDDEVLEWAEARKTELFVDLDEAVQRRARVILAAFPKLIDTRSGRSGADPFVIALAAEHECAVVTGEQRSGSLKRPKIPDVCRELAVPCISLLDLIREQGWRF